MADRFLHIEKIVVASGSICISSDGEITGATKAEELVVGVLTLSAAGRRHSGSSVVTNNFGSFIGRTTSVFNGSDGTMSMGNDGINITCSPDETLVINGHRITVANAVAAATGRPVAPPPPKKSFWLDVPTTRIRNIQTQGSLAICQVLLERDFNVAIRGSGDFSVSPGYFNSIELVISGSADANLDGVVTNRATLLISGSGDIEGLSVLESAALEITGSGDLSIFAAKKDRVSREVYGSGKIRVHQIEANTVAEHLISASARALGTVAGVPERAAAAVPDRVAKSAKRARDDDSTAVTVKDDDDDVDDTAKRRRK